MYLELAAAGYLLTQYIYHRITDDDPPDPSDRLDVPKVDEGQTVPIFFGRVRIRRPFIAWHGGATAALNGTSPTGRVYEIRILFVGGMGFFAGETHLRNIWWGDYAMTTTFDLPPNIGGTPYLFEPQPLDADDPEFAQALVEYADGDSTQDLGTGSLTATFMVLYGIAAELIPGFRGVATVFMDINKFTSTLPDIDLELSSYPTQYLLPFFISTKIGEEANPAIAIAALLCDQNKHGLIPGDVLDVASFRDAADTLIAEGHGTSICWEQRESTRDMINDVLRQIDGTIWQDQNTGRWHIKLIRADYDANNLRDLDPSNCRLENFAAGGWVDTPNSVRIVYGDRADGYRDNSAVAQNPANAVGQNGERIEREMRYPGIKTSEVAEAVAARELGWVSKPLIKCTAFASREMIDVTPGQVLRLTYPELNIAGRVMRVAGISYALASDNHVRLDLIEDVFYVFRRRVFIGDEVTPFPSPDLDPG